MFDSLPVRRFNSNRDGYSLPVLTNQITNKYHENHKQTSNTCRHDRQRGGQAIQYQAKQLPWLCFSTDLVCRMGFDSLRYPVFINLKSICQ